MNVEQFESIKSYVQFDDQTTAELRAFHPIALPHFERFATDFYDTIDRVPAARAVITGGRSQIGRLKCTLVEWMDSTLSGPHDSVYLEARSRIGHVHVRIGLPQEFMFTAMNRMRTRFSELGHEVFAQDSQRALAVLTAVDKIFDIELAIMVDTYREHLLEKVRAAERLAVIGQLAASIGHELRNPLGTIESSLYLVRQRLGKLGLEDPQIAKHHTKIESQVKHCGKTINNLLDLARDRPPRRQRNAADQLIARAAEQAALPAGVSLRTEGLTGLTVDADPDDFLHVFVNLLVNAAQAQGQQGQITVQGGRWKGGTVLRVCDEGPGVPLEIRHRIFDALFTTKARGTGLGLALARRILYAHGGELELEPSERGAVFRVWLPDVVDTESDPAIP